MRENFGVVWRYLCNSVNLNPFELTLQLAGLFDYTVNYEFEISFFYFFFKHMPLRIVVWWKLTQVYQFFFLNPQKYKKKYNSWIFNEKNGPAKCRVCPFPRHAQDITTR